MDFQTKTDISLNYFLNILHQKEITILGHDNIDIDAALSGILLSKLLDFLGIKNQFQIFGPIKEDETYTVIRDLIGINLRTFEVNSAQENEQANLFLVDHYETTHKGTVIGYIDHHPTIKEPQASFHFSKNSSATAFLIYQFMQQYNYPINKQDALMIVTAMMADTVCFKSSKAVPDEINVAQQLATTYNLDWNLIKKYTLCLTPIDKMSVSEIISNGEKQYNYNGSKVFSSYVQLEQLPDEQTLNDWLSALSTLLSTQEHTMSVFLLFDITANQTQEYQITQEQIRKFIHNRIVSRGKDIMPKIEKLFQQKMSIDEQNNNDIDI